jgi:hypothetical protein
MYLANGRPRAYTRSYRMYSNSAVVHDTPRRPIRLSMPVARMRPNASGLNEKMQVPVWHSMAI